VDDGGVAVGCCGCYNDGVAVKWERMEIHMGSTWRVGNDCD
jgi:hypothetical protein